MDTPMNVDQAPVEVLPGQLSIEDADTPKPHPMSTIVDIMPVSEAANRLLRTKRRTLTTMSTSLPQGMQTFVEVGHALLTSEINASIKS